MKIDLPGLLKEMLPSGNYRYRVRVEGNKARRIRLHVGPDHEDFLIHYQAARRGVEMFPDNPAPITINKKPDPKAKPHKPRIHPADKINTPDSETNSQEQADIIDFTSWRNSNNRDNEK